MEALDPSLELPVVDEVGTWIERALPAGIGLRSGVVWRRERSQFTRQNANRPFEAFTVPVTIRDPGPDGVPDTTDDGGTLIAFDDLSGRQAANIQRNVPGSSSAYWTWEVDATRRTRGRWSLGAGFSHTWNGDQATGYSGQAARSNQYPLTPNDLINTGTGGRHEFTTWTATAHGTYDAPWDVRVTPVMRHQSGQPFGRTFTTSPGQLAYTTGAVTVLAEPIGSRRMDNITIVDLRVEKRLPLKGNRHMSGFLDVFNCFNANPEQNVIWSSGSSFLRPLSIVPPRIAQVGLTLEW